MGGSRLDVGVLLPRVAAGVGWGGDAGWRRGRSVADRSHGTGAGREVNVTGVGFDRCQNGSACILGFRQN